MLKNRIKEALEARGVAIGTWVQMKSPEACELAGAAGFDFIIIDMEHGTFGIEGALEMIRAVESQGAAPVLRLPDGSATTIKKALDAGANGIIIPGIRTGEQALQIVQAAKYEPKGKRGACPSVRATMHGLIDWKKYSEWSNGNTLVWPIIENTDAVSNISQIVSAGVDGIVLGPFDLSMSMGLGGDMDGPDIKKALEHVMKVALERGVNVVAVLFEAEPERILASAQHWLGLGCRIITALSDRALLANAYKDVIHRLKE